MWNQARFVVTKGKMEDDTNDYSNDDQDAGLGHISAESEALFEMRHVVLRTASYLAKAPEW